MASRGAGHSPPRSLPCARLPGRGCGSFPVAGVALTAEGGKPRVSVEGRGGARLWEQLWCFSLRPLGDPCLSQQNLLPTHIPRLVRRG